MNRLAATAALAVFCAALFFLHAELKNVHLHEVAAAFRAIPSISLVIAFALAAGSYGVLTGYDVLGLRYAEKPLPYRQVAKASFMAFAVGNNLGLALLTGGSVRYRLYSRAGLSATEVGKVVAMCTVTFGLGVIAVLAAVCLLAPGEVTGIVSVEASYVRVIGGVLLALLGAYTAWNGLRRAPLEVRGIRFSLPGVRMTLAQFALAGVDLALAAAVLYVLLPANAELSYATFLGLYVVAMAAAVLSNVPGGVGVFEAVLIAAAPGIAANALLGSILAYRVIYYLLPLGVAAALLVANEIAAKRTQARHLAVRGSAMVGAFAPRGLGMLVFAAGAVLVLSGSTPAEESRLSLLEAMLPLPVIEISHLVASLIGLTLLLVSRGLFMRLDAAWLVTFALLVAGALLSVLKGFDWEEATVLCVTLAVLVVSRQAFYRKASLAAVRFTPGWMAAVAIVLVGSFWLGLFAYKHVEYSDALWWQFALDDQAPRFLRASLAVAVAALAAGGWYLMRPERPAPAVADADELARALPIVQSSARPDSWLATIGDKRLLFDASGEAFVMYGVQGSTWVAMGDPVGPESAWDELLWNFRELADRHGGRPVFYQVDGTKLPHYLDLGLQAVKLGEAARVPLDDFSLEGKRRAHLRQARSRAMREGASFEILPPEAVAANMPALKRISDTWLGQKNVAEKGFSVGRFDPTYLARTPCAVVSRGGVPVAFANLWPGADAHELTIDLMRFGDDAPKGVMDYLFVELMLWGKAQGFHWFDLGMAPLSGLETHALATFWHRAGSFVFRHGEHFYNFEGLRAYKQKFEPVWAPRYLASRGGLGLAPTLFDVATLISGSARGIVSRRQ